MGQAWCRDKMEKAEDSKSPLNKIFLQCAHRIYPPAKEDVGCATQRVTRSEIGYVESPRKVLMRSNSIDSVDRPFSQSDWVDVNLEVNRNSTLRNTYYTQKSLDSDLYHEISPKSMDHETDDAPKPPPRRKKKIKGRPLPPTPQDNSQTSFGIFNIESLYASVIPKLKKNRLEESHKLKNVYEHKVNGTGEIISNGKKLSNQYLPEVHKGGSDESIRDCILNDETKLDNNNTYKSLNEINKIQSDEKFINKVNDTFDTAIKLEESMKPDQKSLNTNSDIATSLDSITSGKRKTFEADCESDFKELGETELSNQSKESKKMLSLNESEPEVDSASKLTKSISEESIPRSLMLAIGDEEGTDQVDFFDDKIIKDTKNEMEKIREELEKNELKIRSSLIKANVNEQSNYLGDELNESNLSSMTPSLTELSDMLDKECENNSESISKSLSDKFIEPKIVPSIIEESHRHCHPSTLMDDIDLTNKKEEQVEGEDSKRVNIDNSSMLSQNEPNLFYKEDDINLKLCVNSDDNIPTRPHRQNRNSLVSK